MAVAGQSFFAFRPVSGAGCESGPAAPTRYGFEVSRLSRSSRRRLLGALAAAVIATTAATGCRTAQEAIVTELVTTEAGTLRVAAVFSSPGFWNGSGPASVDGGFEWALANELADHFGLDLDVVGVPFEDMISGDLGGADLALAQITPTDERRAVLDFGVGYLDADFGVLVAAGESVRDLATARALSWSTVRGSLEEQMLLDTIRPDGVIEAVPDESAAAQLVLDGVVDAALIDLTSALVIAGGDARLTVASKVLIDATYAAGFPSGSPNREPIDAVVRGLARAGVLGELEERWLTSIYEQPAESVPVIRM